MNRDAHSADEIRSLLELKNIAVVGMSNTDGKAANYVPSYLIEQGYNVIPVNPNSPQVMGRKSYESASKVPDKIDILNIFRPSQDVPAVVKDALQKDGIKVVWMQEGIYSEEAERMALEKGIEVVYNRCMMVEHERLVRNSG
jgi:predicted CoA-binding protein